LEYKKLSSLDSIYEKSKEKEETGPVKRTANYCSLHKQDV
jgi:hypothetical protein